MYNNDLHAIQKLCPLYDCILLLTNLLFGWCLFYLVFRAKITQPSFMERFNFVHYKE